MKSILTSLLVLTVLLINIVPSKADQEAKTDHQVELKQSDNKVEVLVDGKPFTIFNYAPNQPKPYFSPVRSPEGIIMTRSVPMPKGADHKHHKGIWITVHKVNGHNFWGEGSLIKNKEVKILVAKGNPAKFEVVNHWVDKDDKPVLIEKTKFSIDANRLIAFEINLTAGENPVIFGDTKEGFLGFRMVASMQEKETGRVENAEGLKGTGQCWGKYSKWIDYVGNVEGKVVGVTLMDNPTNFRPSRYHVRNYGLFSISPFGERKYTNGKEKALLLELNPSESIQIKYGLYIHSGETAQAKIPQVYEDYLKMN